MKLKTKTSIDQKNVTCILYSVKHPWMKGLLVTAACGNNLFPLSKVVTLKILDMILKPPSGTYFLLYWNLLRSLRIRIQSILLVAKWSSTHGRYVSWFGKHNILTIVWLDCVFWRQKSCACSRSWSVETSVVRFSS